MNSQLRQRIPPFFILLILEGRERDAWGPSNKLIIVLHPGSLVSIFKYSHQFIISLIISYLTHVFQE